MKKVILAVAVVAIGVAFAIGARAQGIKEGKWTMTMVTKVPGMDKHAAEMEESMKNMSDDEKAMMQGMMGKMGMNMQAGGNSAGITTTVTKCLTNDNPVPQKDDSCTSTHTLDGNTVKFETTCADSHSTGEITYQNESMNGTITSQSADGEATIEITGEYVEIGRATSELQSQR